MKQHRVPALITSLSDPVTRPGNVRGWRAPRCSPSTRPAAYWSSVTRCGNRSRTRRRFRTQTRGYNVPASHCKAPPNGNPRRRASRPAPGPAPAPSSPRAGTPPAPGTCPAVGACICTSCSGTIFWPAWGRVRARGPGALSPGRTGSAAAWSASPARTLGNGRRGLGASCAAGLRFGGVRHSQVNCQRRVSLHGGNEKKGHVKHGSCSMKRNVICKIFGF